MNLRAVVSGDRPPAVVDSYVDHEGRAHSFVLTNDAVDVSPWLHVLYADEEKSEALAGLVDGAVAEFVNVEALAARSRSDDGEYYRAHEDLLTVIGQDLARLAQLMKPPGFAGEDEVRVLAVDDPRANNSTRAARFRSTPFGVARYMRLSASTTVVANDAEPYVDPSATLYEDDEDRQLPDNRGASWPPHPRRKQPIHCQGTAGIRGLQGLCRRSVGHTAQVIDWPRRPLG